MNMNEFKDLEEIIELCKEELDANDENVSATLDTTDLKALRDLLIKYEKLKTFKNEVKQIKREYPSTDIDDCVNLALEIDCLLKGETNNDK